MEHHTSEAIGEKEKKKQIEREQQNEKINKL